MQAGRRKEQGTGHLFGSAGGRHHPIGEGPRSIGAGGSEWPARTGIRSASRAPGRSDAASDTLAPWRRSTSRPPSAPGSGALAERHGERELIVQDARRLRFAEAEDASARLALGARSRAASARARASACCCRTGPTGWSRGSPRRGSAPSRCRSTPSTRRASSAACCATPTCSSLLTAPRFLNHDYLARLEESRRRSRRRRRRPLRLRELPYLRARDRVRRSRDRGLGGARRAAASRRDPAIDALPARGRGAGRRPPIRWSIIYSSGSTADPKGAVHSHGTRDPPLLHPRPRPRRARRRPHLVADAVLLGGRPRLHAARHHARRRLHALRGGLRARAHARACSSASARRSRSAGRTSARRWWSTRAAASAISRRSAPATCRTSCPRRSARRIPSCARTPSA